MTKGRVFVWDTTGPAYAWFCERCDSLLEAAGTEDRRHVLPSDVVDELRALGTEEWEDSGFDIVDCDALTERDDFRELNAWCERLGTDLGEGHNVGEAFVALIASREEGAVAIIDDKDAKKVVSKSDGPPVHGVQWAISRGVIEGRKPSPSSCSGLVDAMLAVEPTQDLSPLRWPLQRGDYNKWFDKNEKKLRRI